MCISLKLVLIQPCFVGFLRKPYLGVQFHSELDISWGLQYVPTNQFVAVKNDPLTSMQTPRDQACKPASDFTKGYQYHPPAIRQSTIAMDLRFQHDLPSNINHLGFPGSPLRKADRCLWEAFAWVAWVAKAAMESNACPWRFSWGFSWGFTLWLSDLT